MTTAIQSVASALEGVTAWRVEQESRVQSELVDVESQLEKLRAEIEGLEEKCASLEEFRANLADAGTVGEAVSRSYTGLFEALATQSAALRDRAAQAFAAEATRRTEVFQALDDSNLAPLISEYRQFKEQVAPSLSALPESYREAIVKHHEGISDRIRSHLAKELGTPGAIDAEPIALDVVFGIDAPEGAPELLICVLPVPDEAFTAWADRDEDLCTLVGARVVQGLYETVKQTGPQGAQAVCGGHQGLLAVEMEVDGAPDDLERALTDTLNAVLSAAPELAAAKIAVTAHRVDFDFLLPPDLDEEEE